jgi:alginate O-acetyltransferase complex protein AlgI
MLLVEKWVPGLQKLPGLLRHGYVLLVVVFSFVLFNATDLNQAAQDFAGMMGLSALPPVTGETLYYLRSFAFLFVVGFVAATPLFSIGLRWFHENEVASRALTVAEPIVMVVLLLLCTAYLVDGSFNPFLYFRF